MLNRTTKVAGFIDHLIVSDRIRQQASARYDRMIAQGRDAMIAKQRVTAWALAEQRKLDTALRDDPWMARVA